MRSLLQLQANTTSLAKVEAQFLSDPGFNAENIKNKSSAAAGLCGWCINICKYFRIYQMVAPIRAALAEANVKLDAANAKLAVIQGKLAELDAKLQVLTDQFEEATAEKNAAIATAEKTQVRAPSQHGLSSTKDDPSHLRLRCNALPEHQMALITSGCVPFRPRPTWPPGS